MTFYKDLTYYIDKHFENALNVGWEENPEPYDYGRIFEDRIGAYLKYTVLHQRQISQAEEIVFKDTTYQIGYGEFRVIGSDGTVYACPDTLIGKVFAGEYKLPDCFVKAVNEGMDPDSLAYRIYLENFTPEKFWGASENDCWKLRRIRGVIQSGDLEELKRNIETDGDLLKMMTDQGSLLNMAIQNNQQELALYLADQNIPYEMFHGRELLYAIDAGMESVALKLLDKGIPMNAERIGVNPLFIAIRKPMNSVAKKLFLTHKELIQTYDDIYVGKCNLLQWTKRTQNDEMLQFIINQYQQF